MSNYSLEVNNSRLYDPSLRSAISSLNQRQEEAHRLADAAYGEMSAKANMLEQLANDVQGKDSVAYQNYMNYANALRQHTDMLATQGLNPSTWNNIIKAKNDYSRIISPIENAMKKREEAAKYQSEYIKQHPDAIFEREAGEMGIDQWMKNPNYIPKVIDRRALEERAKERYSALNTQLMEWISKNGGLDAIKTKDPQAVKKWFKVNVPWLYESMYKTGVNPDDLEKLAAGDPSMQNSLLGAILNDTVRSSGVLSMNTSYDHFTDAQNRQRYQNILDKVMSSVRGASSHSIGETKFDKYDDRISADLLKQSREISARAAEAEADRAWKEKMARGKGGGSGTDKWKHYWQDGKAITDLSTKDEVNEAVIQQQIRTFIKAQPELAKKITSKEWNDILDEIARENKLNSKSFINIAENINLITDKVNKKIVQNNKENDDLLREYTPSNSNYRNDYLARRKDGGRTWLEEHRKYNDDGTIANSTSLFDDHEDYMKKNVRTKYDNGKSKGENEADEDELLDNMTKYDNLEYKVSNLSPEDIKNDVQPLINTLTGDRDEAIKQGIFLNKDGEPYKDSKWFTKDQGDFVDEVLKLGEGVKPGQWSKSFGFDSKGRALIKINVNNKETFVSPKIIGIPKGREYAQQMLDIITENEKIIRKKSATKKQKQEAELNKNKAIQGLGYILGADKDWHTKPDANGYDGDKNFIEQEMVEGLSTLFNKQ